MLAGDACSQLQATFVLQTPCNERLQVSHERNLSAGFGPCQAIAFWQSFRWLTSLTPGSSQMELSCRCGVHVPRIDLQLVSA